ncbi:uncharacterized protein [Haliotis asinina]|uniref:uncharacterized protein n=1 Tax=Haliotis asinina TaxID=109174 RepID=UPI00353246DB
MTMFNNGFLLVFVAVLAPSLGSQPAPNELPDKLRQALNALTQAKSDFQCIFDVSDEQCPCQTPGDPSCFETDLENINSTLCELIANLTELSTDQPTDCPALEGCAAVVTGNYSDDLSVVDPVGTILPSIQAANTVNELVITGDNDTFYSICYITNNNGFSVSRLSFPDRSDSVFYTSTDGQNGKGISFYGDEAFVSVSRSQPVLLSINGTGFTTELVNLTCPGTVREFNGRICFGDCNEIKCVNTDGSDVTTRVKFSMNIASFDVIDGDRTVFCDMAGGLWIYNSVTDCFKLVECESRKCEDVKINRCDTRVYVAYADDVNLEIFNTTTCTSVGDLKYADEASAEPRLDFQPPWEADHHFILESK